MRKLRRSPKKVTKLRRSPRRIKGPVYTEKDWANADISFELKQDENCLCLYWKYSTMSRVRDTMTYLKHRYPEGHIVGDFLKDLLRVKLELADESV